MIALCIKASATTVSLHSTNKLNMLILQWIKGYRMLYSRWLLFSFVHSFPFNRFFCCCYTRIYTLLFLGGVAFRMDNHSLHLITIYAGIIGAWGREIYFYKHSHYLGYKGESGHIILQSVILIQCFMVLCEIISNNLFVNAFCHIYHISNHNLWCLPIKIVNRLRDSCKYHSFQQLFYSSHASFAAVFRLSEDERNLLYVAASRAKCQLILSPTCLRVLQRAGVSQHMF